MEGLYNVSFSLLDGNSSIRFMSRKLPMSEVPAIGDYVIDTHNYSRSKYEPFKVNGRSINYDKKEIHITFE